MLDFIVNPIAGGKHGKKTRSTVARIEEILKLNSVPYTIHFTRHKGHAKELTAAVIDKGATDIIVVGGDGTLHEVINGFKNFDRVNLGLIPCGTGNDFAQAVKIPLDPVKALEIILNNLPKYTDFMQMPTVRGMNVIGTGLDVQVLKKYEALKKKTKFGYTRCLIKTLFNFDYADFKADLDGNEETHHSFIAAIANGQVFGGGLAISPNAHPADGKLNFVAVSEMKLFGIIKAFIKLKNGKLHTLKQTTTKTCESVDIITEKPCTVNVDGELYDGVPFSVKVVTNTLKMYRP
jgi:YegS/Rv2252/BmrU family lipid kinase